MCKHDWNMTHLLVTWPILCANMSHDVYIYMNECIYARVREQERERERRGNVREGKTNCEREEERERGRENV